MTNCTVRLAPKRMVAIFLTALVAFSFAGPLSAQSQARIDVLNQFILALPPSSNIADMNVQDLGEQLALFVAANSELSDYAVQFLLNDLAGAAGVDFTVLRRAARAGGDRAQQAAWGDAAYDRALRFMDVDETLAYGSRGAGGSFLLITLKNGQVEARVNNVTTAAQLASCLANNSCTSRSVSTSS